MSLAANTFCVSFSSNVFSTATAVIAEEFGASLEVMILGVKISLFATYMYKRLGVAWATSLLRFLCIAMMPFPILFYLHGKKMRAKRKFAFAL